MQPDTQPGAGTPFEGASEELCTKVVAGDRTAIGDLLERELPALRVFVRLQVGPALRQRESCSDLVQSTCRELLEGLDGDGFEFRGAEQLRHWLCKAALNKIRQRQRYHQAAQRAPAREVAADAVVGELYRTLLTPSRVAVGREAVARLEEVFDALPEHHREVILLCRVVGLPQEEVARRTGRTVDAVRNLLWRALARVSALAVEQP